MLCSIFPPFSTLLRSLVITFQLRHQVGFLESIIPTEVTQVI